ncbi:hypothetical protein [Leptospira biflexa]|uniref:hypothetical protein n=1 Tax=Leptospira biflexa TaxID=172 RepID=UPI001083663E|nr:hypothetical protein [Leptospira biflexa]TGM36734.1 hypothetical protein EHQ89_08415 [Leptospira biflexa]TGM39718.1 hypothetical protein EHQ80_00520 [Leptospira biflexa]TGM54116.1 hypothetical protein EHQ91_03725 [Leptospira biflexa]
MEKKLHWMDHKSTNMRLVRYILMGTELVTIAALGFAFWMSEFQEEDLLTLGIVAAFFLFFFGLPHVILAYTTRPMETVFDLETKTIHWYDRKKEIRSLSFRNIESISYSEYSYTVNTKNGTRTITVFTVLGKSGAEKIQLIESTQFSKLRFDGELICKQLQIPLINADGTEIPFSDLDLPIHKRKRPNSILENEVVFSPNSQLSTIKSNLGITLKSDYKPRIIMIVVFFVSLAFSLILHFAIGDLLELSAAHWEVFPPTLSQILFGIISVGIGFFPYLYVLYKQSQLKEITITKTSIRWYGKEYLYSDWEDLIQMENRLCLVNDSSLKPFSLFYFCDFSDSTNVRHWILKQIFEVTGGNLNDSRF